MEPVTNYGRTLDDLTLAGSQLARSESLGQQDFLRLMIEQMKNQNPLSPQDNTEFISQIAQFDTLTAMHELVEAVQAMAQVNELSNAGALIGRNVTAFVDRGPDPETGFPREPEAVTGRVDRVVFRDGEAVAYLGTRQVPFAAIREVA